MSAVRLLQVCNVGQIVGGTAACAWTVTRALPEFEHNVAFLSEITHETRREFAHVQIARWSQCTRRKVDELRPDVVLLHNISGGERMSRRAVTLQYVHSAGKRAPADVTVCCSRWLATQMGRSLDDVLYQGVPRPLPPDQMRPRGADGRLVIGRICTPTARKWPRSLLPLYRELSASVPEAEWEFVGCPDPLQSELSAACGGRARFFAASWKARSRMWNWDALLYHNPDVTESFGRIVAESLRAGCVPIVDARGGFMEQVTAETGFLCASLDEYSWDLDELRDVAVRRRMSLMGSAAGDRRFSIAAFRERLLERIRAAVMNSSDVSVHPASRSFLC